MVLMEHSQFTCKVYGNSLYHVQVLDSQVFSLAKFTLVEVYVIEQLDNRSSLRGNVVYLGEVAGLVIL